MSSLTEQIDSIASYCQCLRISISELYKKIEENDQVKLEIVELEDELADLLIDLAILEEMYHQEQIQEKEEESYDPIIEVFTSEDY